jgi:death-on-curing protein
VLSAIARPHAEFGGKRLFPRIEQKAAALVEALAGRNHGFVDGNKRTAFICMNILLNNSGYRLADLVTDREVEEIMVAVAQSEFEFLRLVEWFKARIVRM